MKSSFVLSSGCHYLSIVMKISHRIFSLIAAIALPMVPAAAQQAAPPQTSTLPSMAPVQVAAGVLDWTSDADGLAAANHLIALLETADIEGFAEGPSRAAQARAIMAGMTSGNPAAAAQANRFLTDAFLDYAEFLQAPVSSVLYGDDWARPPRLSRSVILQNGQAVPSLESVVKRTTRINPVYQTLKAAALAAELDEEGKKKVIASLNRARAFPERGRFVLVDSATQRLWMIENGHVVDHMKVVVGKAEDPYLHTPEISSVIYYSTHNPYWHVPKHLVRGYLADGVLREGVSYLKRNGYEVLASLELNAPVVDPSTINWKEVKKTGNLAVRQKPSDANSMGDIKFNFTNPEGIYLHDTPKKEYFSYNERDLSNGCIRLEDAFRFARWLWKGQGVPQVAEIEKHLVIPEPVPVFVTYLTAHAMDGQLVFAKDIYRRDSATLAQVAALNARASYGSAETQGAPAPTMR